MAQHGDYNGWCRVQGIPNRSDECVECLQVKVAGLTKKLSNEHAAYDRIQRVGQDLLTETKTLRAIVKRLRAGWVAYIVSETGETIWWHKGTNERESMTGDEKMMLEAIDG